MLNLPVSSRVPLRLEGLIALYKDYRALTDELYGKLTMDKRPIETSSQAWAHHHVRIRRALAVSPQ